jgi:IclR family KDG regulon transcriptional repressor
MSEEVGSRALERGLRILGLFSDQERSLSVREISSRLRVPLATTYRLVRTLVDLGYLTDRREHGGEIELGLEIMRLASVAAGSDVLTASSPLLRELAQETGETAVLLVPGEWTATCIGMAEGTSPIRPRSARVGESVPYNAGAIPFTLLAYADFDVRQRIIAAGLHRYTSKTPVQAAEVERICAAVRADGFGFSDGEYIDGTAAAAAPIFDEHAQVIASVGVTGISANVVGAEGAVIRAAAEITLRLGGRPAVGQVVASR